jgi:UDP-glucose 4-epimerase
MRVLVTGAAGFLGSHLCDALLTRGDRVVGVDNLIGGYLDNVPRGVSFTQGDCNDLALVKRAMRGVDVVYHCAATAHEGLSVFSPHENVRHGHSASAAVFAAACDARVGRIVFCSSMARYGRGERPPPFTEDMRPMPEDPYGIGKVASEELLRCLGETHGVEWAVVVPHNIYGPRQKYDDFARNVVSIFTNLMLQGRQPFIYGDGSQMRSFSYVSDVVEPMVRMVDSPDVVGEVVNLGPDSNAISVLEAAREIASILEFPLDPVFMKERPREVKVAHCSAEKARRLLGYATRVGIADGFSRTVDWIRSRGAKPFSYQHLDIEIDSALVPETWSRRLM